MRNSEVIRKELVFRSNNKLVWSCLENENSVEHRVRFEGADGSVIWEETDLTEAAAVRRVLHAATNLGLLGK